MIGSPVASRRTIKIVIFVLAIMSTAMTQSVKASDERSWDLGDLDQPVIIEILTPPLQERLKSFKFTGHFKPELDGLMADLSAQLSAAQKTFDLWSQPSEDGWDRW